MRRLFHLFLAVLAFPVVVCRAAPAPNPTPTVTSTPIAAPTFAPTRTPTVVPEPANEKKLEKFKVHESLGTIWVDIHTPYPPEVENDTQARGLAKEAATAVGQNAILRYVLDKRTSKGKPLSEAQIPSTEIQDGLKALISGAQVTGVRFEKDGCRLRVSVDKKNLKVILRKG